MTFDGWIEPHLSAMQINDSTINMMRAAFDAGKSCNYPYNEQHELLGVASELCSRVESDMPTLRDKVAIAAMQTMIAGGGYQKWEDISNDAYMIADAMLKEREK